MQTCSKCQHLEDQYRTTPNPRSARSIIIGSRNEREFCSENMLHPGLAAISLSFSHVLSCYNVNYAAVDPKSVLVTALRGHFSAAVGGKTLQIMGMQSSCTTYLQGMVTSRSH